VWRSSTACRVVSVQNPYSLVNRAVDNGLDEALHRSGVSLLAYSPLGFGSSPASTTTGHRPRPTRTGRLARFEQHAHSAGPGPSRWRQRVNTTRWRASMA
jgi:aryl-alcohol dehydrogenase-like predicted oxidoreductase